MNLFFLLSLLFAALAIAQEKPCNIDDTYLKGQSFDFKPVRPNGKGFRRSVGGTLRIKDGCNMQCFNCTVIPPGLKVYWYGIPKGQPEGKLIARVVAPMVGTLDAQTVDITSTVAYSEMDGIALYSEDDKQVYMKAMWAPDKEAEEDAAVELIPSFIGIIALYLAMFQ